jgi:hypothetical protein
LRISMTFGPKVPGINGKSIFRPVALSINVTVWAPVAPSEPGLFATSFMMTPFLYSVGPMAPGEH